jgi:hypothetical protein
MPVRLRELSGDVAFPRGQSYINETVKKLLTVDVLLSYFPVQK